MLRLIHPKFNVNFVKVQLKFHQNVLNVNIQYVVNVLKIMFKVSKINKIIKNYKFFAQVKTVKKRKNS